MKPDHEPHRYNLRSRQGETDSSPVAASLAAVLPPPGSTQALPACICRDCMPKAYTSDAHQHDRLRASVCTRSSQYHQQLPLHRFEVLDLAQTAVASFQRPRDQLCNFQRQALVDWRRWHARYWHALDRAEDASTVGSACLRACLSIANRLFFLGAIGDVQILWNSALWPRFLGVTQLPPNRLPWIELSPRTVQVWAGPAARPEERVGQLVGTLFHEAVHAFIHKHACNGEDRQRACACLARGEQNLGSSGHGRGWQMLAAAIEAFTRAELGVAVSLSRARTLALGLDPATSCDLRKFYADDVVAGLEALRLA